MLINCCSLLRTETLRHTSSSLRLCYSSRLSTGSLMQISCTCACSAGPVGGRGLAWPSFTVLQFSQPKNGQNHTCGASRRVCSAPTDIVTYPFLKTHASNPAFPTGLGLALGLERFGFCSGGVERRDRPRPFYRRYYKIIGRWSHSHPCWGRSVACWGEVQRGWWRDLTSRRVRCYIVRGGEGS